MSAPPVARLALAFAAGVGWGVAGAPPWSAPLLGVLWLAAPISTSRRPARGLWMAAAIVGAVAARGALAGPACAVPTPGTSALLSGRFLAAPRSGSAPFRPDGGCDVVTVVTPDTALAAGVAVTLRGRWMSGRRRPWLRAESGAPTVSRAGRAASRGEGSSPLDELPWLSVRWRDGLVRRLDRLYGARAPLVAALVLARREGLDRGVGETFARTGIAHLLAISGFHVGVIAGAVLALLRLAGLGARRAALAAAGVAWAYVALIGFPDAACRAALILALVALSRARGSPPARWGAPATALLLLLATGPERLASPGFQLSFAGAAGLVAWSRSVTRWLVRVTGRRCPRSLASALGAGVAATLATLPVVAWHFERVSLVGIPMTLLATPLVSLALPGAILSLLVDPVLPGVATFLAGGVDVLLAVLEGATARVAEWPWASAWTTRPTVVAGSVGCLLALALARHPRVGGPGRRALVLAYACAGIVAWPLLVRLGGWGTLEVVAIDVGQGDAIAIRSPRGRWALVDTGPPDPTSTDPGAHPVVRALRRRGVSRLEALVLTHADLDHIGGATAVLSSLEVRSVLDPALPSGKAEYLAILGQARGIGVPWIAARAGRTIPFDGAELRILHPSEPLADAETNEASVVLHVRFGDFDALLTGDAYKETDREVAASVPGLEVLKVGHHGSDTSTDSLLLALARPRVALISVGRFNRYGHPAPEVLRRLERAGAEVHRTDREGTISVVAHRDGSFEVRPARGGGG